MYVTTFLTAILVILGVLMTFLIMLQEGKGGGMAALGGTKAAAIEGVTNPIRRATAYMAILFFIFAVALAIVKKPKQSDFKGDTESAVMTSATTTATEVPANTVPAHPVPVLPNPVQTSPIPPPVTKPGPTNAVPAPTESTPTKPTPAPTNPTPAPTNPTPAATNPTPAKAPDNK